MTRSDVPENRVGSRFLRLCLPLLLLLTAGEPARSQQVETVPARSGASLNINPKRIVFDRPGRSATLYLHNQGESAGLFDITLVDRVMLPSGQILPLDEAGTREAGDQAAQFRSARPLLIATPRRVRLEPGTGQTIRIRAGGDAALPAGEYRTHLTVTAIPPADTGITAEQAAQGKPGTLSFRVTSVLGIAIPVIVRIGASDVRASIENVSLTMEDLSSDALRPSRKTPVVSLDLVRLGHSSLFGDIEIHDARDRRDKAPLGLIRSLGVYPEIERRHVRVVLARAPASGETIMIRFIDDDVTPGKHLAEAALTLP